VTGALFLLLSKSTDNFCAASNFHSLTQVQNLGREKEKNFLHAQQPVRHFPFFFHLKTMKREM
jgi:hypothetical protein